MRERRRDKKQKEVRIRAHLGVGLEVLPVLLLELRARRLDEQIEPRGLGLLVVGKEREKEGRREEE